MVKGLACGAALAAVASLVVSMKKDKNKKAVKEISKAARQLTGRVASHAKKLGHLSKAAYGKIVDTTVGEYRGVKALSKSDLAELKKDLRNSWADVQKILKARREGPAKAGSAKK